MASIAACSTLLLVGTINASTATASVNASDSPIVIGAIGQFSGALGSSFAGIPGGLKSWADTVNASGGLSGHPVKLDVEDIASGPAAAGLTAAQTLIGQDHAEAIIDMDSGDGTWLPYVKSHGVVDIQPGTDGASSLTFSNVVQMGPAQVPYTYSIISAAKKAGGKLAVGYCAESPGCAQIPQLFGLMGLKPVVAVAISSSSPDFSAFCEAVKSSGATSYSLFLPVATSTKVTNQCYQDGLRIPQILIASNVTSSLTKDSAFSGSLVVDSLAKPFWDTSDPSIKQIQTALSKDTKGIVGTELDNVYPEAMWAAGDLLAADVKNIKGSVTATSIEKGFSSLHNVSPGGFTAPESFQKNTGTSTYCSYEWKILKGKFGVSATGQPLQFCAPASVVDPIMQQAAKAS
jgi:branched-chain amino acid transport system substrate-binding protein